MLNNNFEKEMVLFGKAVKKVRDARGLKQEDIVKMTGVARSTLNLIENGKRFPWGVNILILCIALEIHPAKLMEMAFHDWEYSVKKVKV